MAPVCLLAQTAADSSLIIAFWNVENLYDTVDDKYKNDEEFLPNGPNRWTGKRYYKKIDKLAEVIAMMGLEKNPDGVTVMGFCEIENKAVMNDLVKSPRIAKRNYQVIHIEGRDARGVDPSFIYNPLHFRVQKAISYSIKLVTDSTHKTRDVLVVSGMLQKEKVVFLVNHWPSRRGGEMASRTNRNAAALVVRKIVDSVRVTDKERRIIIMGDFNDDPINESVQKIVSTVAEVDQTTNSNFYNPMEKLFTSGVGTLAFRDSWNLFDQILLSEQLCSSGHEGLKFKDARVFNKDFLRTEHGNFKGYPFRTYSGGRYTGGYSDHFPVYVVLKNDP